MIEPFEENHPQIPASVFVHERACVIGKVQVGEDSSVWPVAILRGDVNDIIIGEQTSIQDNAVIHVSHDGPMIPGGAKTMIGDDVTIGHMAMLHGCQLGSRILIGVGVTVLDLAVIEDDIIIGAGSLVPPGKTLASGYMYLGSPAKPIRPLSAQEKINLRYSAEHYVRLKNQYLER